MHLSLDCPWDFSFELAAHAELEAVPLHCESLRGDLADLVDEAFARAVLAERLPRDPGELAITIRPLWLDRPIAAGVEIELAAGSPSDGRRDVQRFASGRWTRRGQLRARELRERGKLGDGNSAYLRLIAERSRGAAELRLPPLYAPEVSEATLEQAGVRELGPEPFEPDRVVLVAQRALDDILQHTERAGAVEAGGAVIGRTLRTPQPIAGASTRVVTLLSTVIVDPRHAGAPGRLTFSPEALAEAAEVAELRGQGETVVTAFHSHGWGTQCGRCNQNPACALPTCDDVSGDDYVVLETLFPSKSTVLPIAGRRLGASGTRPVLALHAWNGGRVQPLRWSTYRD